ncbi:hypothetical protein DN069_31240 [Streptacidiphilus pinicola]|uniref:Uncharacterized protein n=1 Tax=Streptacidiphilus pinicola TaxID=2219663 RepID=A0A2X0I9W1_9ACTN|nr:hypothetical protein [Streptacidiphilus pinicola]RAG81734.1 hypothetical protein DN069_31240 [Streptacidiphilus pinicola]
MTTPPVAPLPVWDQVMATAEGRCQCTGGCGRKHKTADQRCEHINGGFVSKHAGPVRLLAAPVDPARFTLPPHKLAQLPAGRLAAWCPTCHDGARLTAQRNHRKQLAADLAASTDVLF